jgi:hypothetical protein
VPYRYRYRTGCEVWYLSVLPLERHLLELKKKKKKNRTLRGSNPGGRCPLDFKSNPLTTPASVHFDRRFSEKCRYLNKSVRKLIDTPEYSRYLAKLKVDLWTLGGARLVLHPFLLHPFLPSTTLLSIADWTPHHYDIPLARALGLGLRCII